MLLLNAKIAGAEWPDNFAVRRHENIICAAVIRLKTAVVFFIVLLCGGGTIYAQSDGAAYDAARARLLASVKKYDVGGPYRKTWASLEQYSVPEWYRDAKFGIFVHWGIYSVPAFDSEWYPHRMYIKGSPDYEHQVKAHGPETIFGYKDFIPMFKAQKFDPNAWITLFRKAGARYVVPVAEHHDGFAMWDTSLSQWSAAKMGPKRDIVGELEKAARAQGMHFGLSSHREHHFWFFTPGCAFPSDVQSGKWRSLYGSCLPADQLNLEGKEAKFRVRESKPFLEDWLVRDAELVEKYHPEIVYFDGWIDKPDYASYLERFAAFYYNYAAAHDFTPVINYKFTAYPPGAAVLDLERAQLRETRPMTWQTDTSVSNKSWGYIENDTFKTPARLIDELADVVSKNGNLLLNVGPRSDGTIPVEVQHVLLAMGAWLNINGEAIYGTRPWTIFGEGPTQLAAGRMNDREAPAYTSDDFRFTTKAGHVYAIELVPPTAGKATIAAFRSTSGYQVQSVSLLGYRGKLRWSQSPNGLEINVPADARTEPAYSYELTLQ